MFLICIRSSSDVGLRRLMQPSGSTSTLAVSRPRTPQSDPLSLQVILKLVKNAHTRPFLECVAVRLASSNPCSPICRCSWEASHDWLQSKYHCVERESFRNAVRIHYTRPLSSCCRINRGPNPLGELSSSKVRRDRLSETPRQLCHMGV